MSPAKKNYAGLQMHSFLQFAFGQDLPHYCRYQHRHRDHHHHHCNIITNIIIIIIIIASQGPEVFVLTRATNSSLPETLPSLTASRCNVSFKYIFRHEHLPPNISIYKSWYLLRNKWSLPNKFLSLDVVASLAPTIILHILPLLNIYWFKNNNLLQTYISMLHGNI